MFTRRKMLNSAVGSIALSAFALDSKVQAFESERLSTLEGELKVHSKFLYRYFLVVLDGQKVALFDRDHVADIAKLSNVKLPARVRVKGTLSSEHHVGGTKDNPSPFPSGWFVYMDVRELELLK